jgi:hypothetical protein
MVPMSPRLPAPFRRGPQPPEGFDGVLELRHGRPYDPAWDRWRPVRRWPGVLVSAVVTAGLLVAIAYHFQSHPAVTSKPSFPTAPNTALSVDYVPPVAEDTIPVQHFSGTKSEFELPLKSPGGLTSWTFDCKCIDNFNVIVRDSSNVIVAIPVNTIGRTQQAAIADYPAGTYSLAVSADGPWSINFIPEAGLPLVKTPFTIISSGTSVLGPFPSSAHTLQVGYLARLGQLLTVQIVDKTGAAIQTPVFTIRRYAKTFDLSGLPNPYYVTVAGQGLWLVKVQ